MIRLAISLQAFKLLLLQLPVVRSRLVASCSGNWSSKEVAGQSKIPFSFHKELNSFRLGASKLNFFCRICTGFMSPLESPGHHVLMLLITVLSYFGIHLIGL